MAPRQPQDDQIGRRIKTELFRQEQSAAPEVQVEVRDGVAHLSGIVDVLADRQKAEEIARSVEGVREVENRITISYDGRSDDKDIEADLRKKLESQAQTEGIGVRVDRGVATLLGRVDTLEQEWLARQLAQNTRGIREIVSNVEVGSRLDDASITNEVERRLANSGLGAAYIDTITRHGVVYLSGWVDHPQDIETAEGIARGVQGVKEVKNELKAREG